MIEIATDMKHVLRKIDDHIKDDDEKFTNIFRRVNFAEKAIYVGIGAVAVLEIVIIVISRGGS